MILSLETSTKVCSVAIHDKGSLVGSQCYHVGQSHSSLIPTIIDELLKNCSLEKNRLKAIAVSEGPGSYTGLRIGAAAAKALCLGFNIPLISLSSLDILAEHFLQKKINDSILIPMIDARRMEVYMKAFTSGGTVIEETTPLIIESDTFDHHGDKFLILFGNGSAKCKEFLTHENYVVHELVSPEASYMGRLAQTKFEENDFSDIAYYQPNYLKEFYTHTPKPLL